MLPPVLGVGAQRLREQARSRCGGGRRPRRPGPRPTLRRRRRRRSSRRRSRERRARIRLVRMAVDPRTRADRRRPLPPPERRCGRSAGRNRRAGSARRRRGRGGSSGGTCWARGRARSRGRRPDSRGSGAVAVSRTNPAAKRSSDCSSRRAEARETDEQVAVEEGPRRREGAVEEAVDGHPVRLGGRSARYRSSAAAGALAPATRTARRSPRGRHGCRAAVPPYSENTR